MQYRILFVLMAFYGLLSAQNNQIDSLLSALKTANSDSVIILLQSDVALAYATSDLDKALDWSQKSLEAITTTSSKYLKVIVNYKTGQLYAASGLKDLEIDYYKIALQYLDTLVLPDYGEKLTLALAHYNFDNEDFKESIIFYEQANYWSETLEHTLQKAATLQHIGAAHLMLDKPRDAYKAYENARLLYKHLNHQSGLASAYTNLGEVFLYQKNAEDAEAYFAEAYQISVEHKDSAQIAQSLLRIGEVTFLQEDYDRALDYYTDALNIYNLLKQQPQIAKEYSQIGQLYLAIDSIDTALKYELKSLVLFRQLEQPKNIAQSLNNLGQHYREFISYDETLAYLEEALRINRSLGLSLKMSDTYLNLGRIRIYQTKFSEALEATKKAKVIAKEQGDKKRLQSAMQQLSEIYTIKKNYKEALISQQDYTTLADEIAQDEAQQNLDNLLDLNNLEDFESTTEQAIKYRKMQTYFWISLTLFFLFLVSVVWLFYKNNRLKKQLQQTTLALVERNKDFENVTEMFQRAMQEERERNSKSRF